MKTRLTLKPGQRFKTVELIIEQRDWPPPPARFSPNTLIPLHIKANDLSARNKAKSAGGCWNPEKQLWFICYGSVMGTILEKYIDVDGFDK